MKPVLLLYLLTLVTSCFISYEVTALGTEEQNVVTVQGTDTYCVGVLHDMEHVDFDVGLVAYTNTEINIVYVEQPYTGEPLTPSDVKECKRSEKETRKGAMFWRRS